MFFCTFWEKAKLTLQNRNIYKYVGLTNFMYFKYKRIKGKKYKYAVKSIRLPDGKVKILEKVYKNQDVAELESLFEKKETELNIKYVLKKFKEDHIFVKEELVKVEEIKFAYKKIKKKLTKVSLGDLLDRFTANFTYESNALEGNSLTLKDVTIVMFENISIRGKDLREIYETRNSRKVVEMIIKNKFYVSHKDIIKIHRILVKDIEIKSGYKTVPNTILGRNIETTKPEMVYQEMDKLIRWYHKNKDKLHPVKIAAIFHGRFEQIHPFEDGNGRVGRFLINVILVNNKYPPLIIRKSQRFSYLKSLENFDNNHNDSLERFMLERFKDTYRKFFEIYIKYI